MEKSPDAFRTISEVAEWLDVPTHVLRFWESRFSQVKPVKRAGGRRYYRPSDMLLIGGIKRLLHDDGMTIRGVQKLLREEGVKHVAGLSQPLDPDTAPGPDHARDVTPSEEPPSEEAPRMVTFRHDLEDAASPDAASQGVLAFGSVRGRARTDDPLPPAEPADTPDLIDEDAPAPDEPVTAPAAWAPAEEPDIPLPPDAAEAAEPAPPPAIPPTPDVPEHDPEDGSPAHAARPGIVARLIASGRRAEPGDIRIEEVVNRLRALRDREAS